MEELKNQFTVKNKVLKQREKEINKLELKCENMSRAARESKEELKALKSDAVKQGKKLKKKVALVKESNNNQASKDATNTERTTEVQSNLPPKNWNLVDTNVNLRITPPNSPNPSASPSHTPPGTPPRTSASSRTASNRLIPEG